MRIDEDFELEQYLKKEANIITDKIGLTIANDLASDEEIDYFIELLKRLIEKGEIEKKDRDKLEKKVLEIAIDKDFLFLREGKITFNSQIIKKGAEVYVNERLQARGERLQEVVKVREQ